MPIHFLIARPFVKDLSRLDRSFNFLQKISCSSSFYESFTVFTILSRKVVLVLRSSFWQGQFLLWTLQLHNKLTALSLSFAYLLNKPMNPFSHHLRTISEPSLNHLLTIFSPFSHHLRFFPRWVILESIESPAPFSEIIPPPELEKPFPLSPRLCPNGVRKDRVSGCGGGRNDRPAFSPRHVAPAARRFSLFSTQQVRNTEEITCPLSLLHC